jgi:hypothetical protein
VCYRNVSEIKLDEMEGNSAGVGDLAASRMLIQEAL